MLSFTTICQLITVYHDQERLAKDSGFDGVSSQAVLWGFILLLLQLQGFNIWFLCQHFWRNEEYFEASSSRTNGCDINQAVSPLQGQERRDTFTTLETLSDLTIWRALGANSLHTVAVWTRLTTFRGDSNVCQCGNPVVKVLKTVLPEESVEHDCVVTIISASKAPPSE